MTDEVLEERYRIMKKMLRYIAFVAAGDETADSQLAVDRLKARADAAAAEVVTLKAALATLGAELKPNGDLHVNMAKYNAVYRCEQHRKVSYLTQDLGGAGPLSPVPDKNCITLPDGDCVGKGCMHDTPLTEPEGELVEAEQFAEHFLSNFVPTHMGLKRGLTMMLERYAALARARGK